MWKYFLHATLKQARRVVVAVIGGTVALLGVVMLVAPGPAFLVIPLGLAILATEFIWARHVLHYVKQRAGELQEKAMEMMGRKKAEKKPGEEAP